MSEFLLSLWPHWARPYWLFVVPVFGVLLWHLWHREKRAGRWQLLLPQAFHAALLSGGRGRASRLPWIALGLAWLLALLALLGPSWQRLEHNNLKPADPLVVVLELTPAMLTGDAPPNRLAQARRKILDLLEARQDAQTAIVVFAGSAHTVVPLSDDLATARNLLDALNPSLMPEPGRRADLAVAQARQLLEQGGQGQGRVLLIASGLDDTEQQGIRQAMGSRGDSLAMLGFGTADGAPIVQEDGSFRKDEQGAFLIARLDSPGLSRFAQSLGARYRSATQDEQDLRSLGLLDAPNQMRAAGEQTTLQAWADQGHWLLIVLLVLAACAGRRGWLFCLPLLMFSLPQPALAFSFDDLWLRADQQGQRLLEAQRPAEAAQRFNDPQWQGLALYEAGDYAAAAERFALQDSPQAHYNRGNALARSNELEAALDAYTQALEQQPDLQAAQHNKAIVEALLRQRQQPQPEQDSTEPAEEQQPGEQSQPAQGGSPEQGKPQDAPAGAEPPAESAPQEPPPPTGESQASPEPASEAADAAEADSGVDGERRQALEQWLRQIPDDPGELLRRKFWYEQQQRQEAR